MKTEEVAEEEGATMIVDKMGIAALLLLLLLGVIL
jgi:hypothetical protein